MLIKLNTKYLQDFIKQNAISLETFLILIKLNGLNNQVPFNNIDREFFIAIYHNRVTEVKQTTLSVLVNALRVHELNLLDTQLNTQSAPFNNFYKIDQLALQSWISDNNISLKKFINQVELVANDSLEFLSILDLQRFKRYYKNTQFTLCERDLSILYKVTGLSKLLCNTIALNTSTIITDYRKNFDEANVNETFKLNNSFITKRASKLNLSLSDCIINFTEIHNYPFDLNVKLTLKWLTTLFTGNQVSAKKRTIVTLAKVLDCDVHKLLEKGQ